MRAFVKDLVETSKDRGDQSKLTWTDDEGTLHSSIDDKPYCSNQALSFPGSSKSGSELGQRYMYDFNKDKRTEITLQRVDSNACKYVTRFFVESIYIPCCLL